MPRKNHADNLTYNKAYYEKNRTRCADAVRKHRELKKSAGVCVMCRRPAVPGIQTCTKHWMCSKANATVGSGAVQTAIALWKLLAAQNHRCALTGKILNPGANASIDHVVPVAEKPELAEDLNNVEWVDLKVNLAKGMLSKAEFIQMCRDVVLFADTKKEEAGTPMCVGEDENSWLTFQRGPSKRKKIDMVIQRHKQGWADPALG
jgi:hypothetical protein